jgi:hypothetical protein
MSWVVGSANREPHLLERSNVMTLEPGKRPTTPFFTRRGASLLITGLILIVVFGLSIMAGKRPGEGLVTPMWVGIALGLGMAGYGLYRALIGPAMLDHPSAGTNNEPQ